MALFTTVNLCFCVLQASLFIVAMLSSPVSGFHFLGMTTLCVLHTCTLAALAAFYAGILLSPARGGIGRDCVLRYLVLFPFGHAVPLSLLLAATSFGTFAREICGACYALAVSAAFLHAPFLAYALPVWFKLYQLLREIPLPEARDEAAVTADKEAIRVQECYSHDIPSPK